MTPASRRPGSARRTCRDPRRGPRPRSDPRPPARSDLLELGILVGHDLVDVRDVLVGELLELLLRADEVIFRDATVSLKFLELLLRVPPDVPNGNPALLTAVMDQLDQLLPALLGQWRAGPPDHAASLPGVIPRSLAMMAFSIEAIAFRSK